MALWLFPLSTWAAVAAISIGLYIIFLAIHRLFLSPLSSFPGPKLAALTLWYEFYYDVVLGGQYTFRVRDLHAQYGPIIRINPYELHVSDPTFYDTLYASSASGEKRDKWEWYTKQLGTPGAMFATAPHNQHKLRRAALNRFFSMASVRRLQPMIEERIAKLLERFRDFKDVKGSDGVIKANLAFAALTNDVVMQYAFGYSDHRLEEMDWAPDYHDGAMETGKQGNLLKQMYFIFNIIKSLPERLAIIVAPSYKLILRMHRHNEAKIAHIKKQPRSTYQDLPFPTLFHEILSSNLPESDKSVTRLKNEAVIVVGAGTLTSSWTLSVATYHLLARPEILAKLKTELKSAVPNREVQPIPLPALENCQYLVAVVQEALRLSYGVTARLQRISPDKEMVFQDQTSKKNWVIPPGTPVSMTTVLVHNDPSIFPDPHLFRPERWIENPRLDRFLVSFSKGSRQCLGIYLAYAEIYLCLYAIFSRFGSRGPQGVVRTDEDEGVLELFETGLSDVEFHADAFLPLASKDSQGVRIKLSSG